MSQARARLDTPSLLPALYSALRQANAALDGASIGRPLVELIFLRASQLNGCGYCIDLHWRELIALGEDPRRINGVAGWRESPLFDARERAALAWAEQVTRLGPRDADDAAYEALRARFGEREAAEVNAAVALIIAWNRIATPMRVPVPRKP